MDTQTTLTAKTSDVAVKSNLLMFPTARKSAIATEAFALAA